MPMNGGKTTASKEGKPHPRFWHQIVLLAALCGFSVGGTLLLAAREPYRFIDASVRVGEGEPTPVLFPLSLPTPGSPLTVAFTVDAPRWDIGPRRFRVYADDCLRSLLINGVTFPITEPPPCITTTIVDLTPYLHAGKNDVLAVVDDFGGLMEFRISHAPANRSLIAVNMLGIGITYALALLFRQKIPVPTAGKNRRKSAIVVGTSKGKLHTCARWLMIVIGAVLIGFAFSSKQIITIDDFDNLNHGEWLIQRYGIGPAPTAEPPADMKWYGPLLDLTAAIASRTVFRPLMNPLWVLRALTFALLPLTLAVTYSLLLRAGYQRATGLLAVAFLLGMIRLGGHAIINHKDFPFACAYLLASISLWGMVRSASTQRRFSIGRLVAMGCIAALPFLLRPVLPVHLVILTCCLVLYAPRANTHPLWLRIVIPVIPLLVAAVATYAFYPILWETRITEWWQSFSMFLAYPWQGHVQFFGIGLDVPSPLLPRWYPLIWFPLLTHPIVLFFLAVGLLESLRHIIWRRPSTTMILRNLVTLDLSLDVWLWLIILCTFGGILIARPNLFDEERHILFLFPPLAVVGAMGFQKFRLNFQYGIAAISIAFSLFTYAQWRGFSYIYMNPLVSSALVSDFMGDYWGTCVASTVRELYKRVPPGTSLAFDHYWIGNSAQRYMQIANAGGIFGIPVQAGEPYPVAEPQEGAPHARIGFNRFSDFQHPMRAVYQGKAELLWHQELPTEEVACVLTYTPSFSSF